MVAAERTRFTRFDQVLVTAPARLHLGFLDLHGGLGRRFGSFGLAIEGLATRIGFAHAATSEVRGRRRDGARDGRARPARQGLGTAAGSGRRSKRRSRPMPASAPARSSRWPWAWAWHGWRAARSPRPRSRGLLAAGRALGHRHRRLPAGRLHPRRWQRRGRSTAAGHRTAALPRAMARAADLRSGAPRACTAAARAAPSSVCRPTRPSSPASSAAWS